MVVVDKIAYKIKKQQWVKVVPMFYDMVPDSNWVAAGFRTRPYWVARKSGTSIILVPSFHATQYSLARSATLYFFDIQ